MTDLDPLESLYFAALERAPTDRPAYLDEACRDKPELRERVERLLAAKPQIGEFLQPPAATVTFSGGHEQATVDYPGRDERIGAILAGKYKLIEAIGEGGMGSVYMAQQTEPVKRRVAVKVIRVERGNSATILARFEAERQAIALMDHPHIAKLLDAGTTDAGQPYFIMELVKGIPLTEFCDAHKLSVQQRLGLFQQICSAVQHAHQKGIIHRDLKPTNILVESHDGKPVPKVIDFGLAKATSGLQLTEHSLFTAFGSVMGTPLYMAPEQATFNAIDVDTRADIYALGVILYELLTGTTPLTRETLKKAALDEMLKLVREQEAPTPSSRLSSAGSLPSVAANRQTEPAKLGRFVKGELDWIVLKALSKERDRRYETANGFAKDIERFLNHEPVAAGPVGAAYKLRKFVRRNRGQVLAASLIFLALIAGISGTTVSMIRAQKAEDLASNRLFDVEKANATTSRALVELRVANGVTEDALKETRESLRQTEMVSSFVVETYISRDSFTRNNPGEYRKILDEGIKRLESNVIVSPTTKANLLHGLGVWSLQIEQPARAIELLEKALAVRKAALGPDHLDTSATMDALAEAYREAGKSDLAIPLCEETVRVRTAKLGPNHKDTLESRWGLALAYHSDKQYDKAIPLLEESLWYVSTVLGVNHYRTEQCRSLLNRAYHANGNGDKAVRLLDDALKALKKTPDYEWASRSIVIAFEEIGQHARAEPLRRAEVEIARKPNGWAVSGALAELGLNLLQQNKYAEVEPLLRECLEIRVKLQSDVWFTFNTKSMLGGALLGQKKYADAEPLLLAGYEGMKQREKTIPTNGKIRLPEALDRLIELSTATNKPDDVKKWQAERAKYPAVAPMPQLKK